MNQDPFDKEQFLRSKLDEYHVNVPEFTRKEKRQKWERVIHFLASPTNNPIDSYTTTTTGIMFLKISPIVGAGVLGLLQILVAL